MRVLCLALAAATLAACATTPGATPAPAAPTAHRPDVTGAIGQPSVTGTATPDGTNDSPADEGQDGDSATSNPLPAPMIAPADDLWTHVRRELSIDGHADRPEVHAAIRAYARDRDVGRVFSGRGQVLMPLVIAEAREHDVPIELAFLPFVESKLNPSASNAGNVGMWQLQSGTARLLGLQTGPGIDERKDPVRATRAAYAYLKRLYRVFDGDWMLALTAYNIGDGRLKNLMASSGTRDVWRLPLPAHCRAHMARLAALWEIARDPASAGVQLPPIADDLHVERLSIDRASTLSTVAAERSIDRQALNLLNAHLGNGDIRSGTQIWLPRRSTTGRTYVASTDTAAAADAPTQRGRARAADNRDGPASERYRVREGDSLYAIARRFGTSVDALKALNGLGGSVLKIGMELRIPPRAR